MKHRRHRGLPILVLLVFTASFGPAIGAQDVSLRIMPSPDTPEADFQPGMAGGWDLSLGYGRVWFENEYLSASMDGAVAAVVYRGTLGSRFGYTLTPIMGGLYRGEAMGFSANTSSVGSGFMFGSRVVGRAESHNLVLFGGGVYSYTADRNEFALGVIQGDYAARAHLFGFAAGVKGQFVPWKLVTLRPFYVYMAGGGLYAASADTLLPQPLETSGGLGYRDVHLLGLDFNIFGISAKLVGDFFRDDAGSVTVVINILDTVRGVKTALNDGPGT